MREKLLEAFKSHAKGHIDKHVANIEVYLHNQVGVGEHHDIMEAIEIELEEMAKYEDHLEILNKYFPDEGPAATPVLCGCGGDCGCK